MAEFLSKGARMLSESCPECGVPLFKLVSDEIICPRCNRMVKMVSENETVEQVLAETKLDKILRLKLNYLGDILTVEKEVSRIKEIVEIISQILKIQKELKK
jgi:uncharacterized Zn finger protein (UPF0148 family)